MPQIVVCALYKFVTLENYQALRQPLTDVMEANQIRGTLLLAVEGINGTVAGPRQGIDNLLNWLRSDLRLADLDCKESVTSQSPFKRTKVKLKKEIVTMGVPGIDPKQVVGTYVAPKDWNSLVDDPEVLLVDTRNDYEFQVGTFKNAINPNTTSFREFPEFVKQHLDPNTHKKVAMFCTGGIRCEKASSYMLDQGFDEVFHLQGGILKYLETVPEEQSMWEGECFVFDQRVAVKHNLEVGEFDQCYACRHPLSPAEMQSEQYVAGISCPHCYDKVSEEKRARLLERQKQVTLAKQRGETHIGEKQK